MIRLRGLLLFLLVTTQHLQLASVAGYPVTLGSLAGLILVATLWKWSPPSPLGTLAILTLASLALATMLLSGSRYSLTEFGASLALLVLGASLVLRGALSRPPRDGHSLDLGRPLFFALVLIATISLLQVTVGIGGSDAFFNPFGEMQYLYQYDPHLEYTAVPRAHGVYLEPSYLAFVTGSIGLILLGTRYRFKASLVLVVGTLLLARSATGILLFLGVFLIAGVVARGRKGIALLIAAVSVWVVAGDLLMARLGTLSVEGSSANYRVQAPLRLLGDVLDSHPFGMPLGTVEQVVATYGLRNGAYSGTSLDNGFYVIVFYFGWLGLLALVLVLAVAAISALRRRNSGAGVIWVLPFWAYGTLAFSGGIFLPEYCLMIWLMLHTYNSEASEVRLEQSAVAVDPNCYLSRPARGQADTKVGGAAR